MTESDERSEIILDHPHISDWNRNLNDTIIGNNATAITETTSSTSLDQQEVDDYDDRNTNNNNHRIKKKFRNVGKECFEKVQSEWRKSTIGRPQSIEPVTSLSSSIPYDQLVQIFIANVNANRYSALPRSLSLVDAVEILSTAWESDAASSDD